MQDTEREDLIKDCRFENNHLRTENQQELFQGPYPGTGQKNDHGVDRNFRKAGHSILSDQQH